MQQDNFKTDGGSLRKIILLGLDNAGKSSIVLTLKGNKSLLSYSSLSPTKNHKITNMKMSDTQINIWDFGGQQVYRNDHLEKIDEYIEGANKLIYVIDVQDDERYDKSLEYFEKVLDLIEEHHENLDFSIFLHKYDPNIETQNPHIKEKIEELLEKIKSILPPEIDLRIFKTTIHTTFEKTPVFL